LDLFTRIKWIVDVLGGYLLTQKDVFFDRSHTCQLISSILAQSDQATHIDLPPPAIRKVHTGRSLDHMTLTMKSIWPFRCFTRYYGSSFYWK